MMISTRKLTKRFGHRAVLRGIDLEVAEGEFVGLLGPNGAGKTTLLRVLASLARPSAGAVNVAGNALPGQAAAVRRQIGVLSHHPLLYGDLSAEQNLAFFGRLYALADLDRRMAEALALVGLAARRRDVVRTFSRGMQQRLAIARALLHDPQVLLLDEPYTGLDQDASAMLDKVLAEVAGQGRTVLMTSHDLARAAALCTRFDVLVNGKLTASMPRSALEKPDALNVFYEKAVAAELSAGTAKANG
jgi:heme exporter protein A